MPDNPDSLGGVRPSVRPQPSRRWYVYRKNHFTPNHSKSVAFALRRQLAASPATAPTVLTALDCTALA
jgi:hypothetical protein